jgi:predicted TPR repeat methyltransferase
MPHWLEAARLDPRLPEPHYNMGRALFTQGKVDEAIKAFQDAIGIDPNYAPAHNNLGVVYWSQNKRKEASECFCRAVSIHPNYAEAWNNLGLAWDGAGKHDEAMECWSRAVSIKPSYAEAHNNLALILEKRGDRAAAIKEWEECLRLRPGWKEVEYYLAVATSTVATAPNAVPPEYLSNLFNEYAENFDQHMTKTLQYRAPELLLEAVKRLGREKYDLVVDLGCGTGLCGEKFRPMATRLVGVDIAPRMIEKAKQRGIYDELLVGDLDSALSGRDAQVDLVLAGDVLEYVGELAPLFKMVAAAKKPDACFAFTVEKPTPEEGEGLILRKTRRFAHSRSYVEQRARDAALEIVEITEAVFRMDYNKPIHGLVCVLKKAPA